MKKLHCYNTRRKRVKQGVHPKGFQKHHDRKEKLNEIKGVCSLPPSLRQLQSNDDFLSFSLFLLPHLLKDLAQEILKTKCDISIPVIVILLEHVRHPLQRNTRLHEQVETHDALVPLVVGPEEEFDEARGEAVAEGDEGVGELLKGDVAGAVDVEAVEEGAPGGEEGPEAAELLKGDGAGAVRVEHADHHPDGLRVEGRPVAVDEGGA